MAAPAVVDVVVVDAAVVVVTWLLRSRLRCRLRLPRSNFEQHGPLGPEVCCSDRLLPCSVILAVKKSRDRTASPVRSFFLRPVLCDLCQRSDYSRLAARAPPAMGHGARSGGWSMIDGMQPTFSKPAGSSYSNQGLLRSVVSLLICIHLFCVAVVLAANSPGNFRRSPLQGRLVSVFAPYTRLLHFDFPASCCPFRATQCFWPTAAAPPAARPKDRDRSSAKYRRRAGGPTCSSTA